MPDVAKEAASNGSQSSVNVRCFYCVVMLIAIAAIMIPGFYPLPAVPIIAGAFALLCILEGWLKPTVASTPRRIEWLPKPNDAPSVSKFSSVGRLIPTALIRRMLHEKEILEPDLPTLHSIGHEIEQWKAKVREFREGKTDRYIYVSAFHELSQESTWNMQQAFALLWKQEWDLLKLDSMNTVERIQPRNIMEKRLLNELGLSDIVMTVGELASSQDAKENKIALEILISEYPFWVEPWPCEGPHELCQDRIGYEIQDAITKALTKPYVSGTYSSLLEFVESAQLEVSSGFPSVSSSHFTNTSLEAFENAVRIVAQSVKHRKRLVECLKDFLPELNRVKAWGVFLPILELIVEIEGSAAIPTLKDCIVEGRWEEDRDRNAHIIAMIRELDPNQLLDERFSDL